MYMRTRYADLSGKEMKSWRKFVKSLLDVVCFVWFLGFFVVGVWDGGDVGVKYPLTLLIIQLFSSRKLIHCVRSTKKKEYIWL